MGWGEKEEWGGGCPSGPSRARRGARAVSTFHGATLSWRPLPRRIAPHLFAPVACACALDAHPHAPPRPQPPPIPRSPIASSWRPEYGAWMIEGTPGAPYGGSTADLRAVERNMAVRRFRIERALPRGVLAFSIVNFPLLGAGGDSFSSPPAAPGGPFSRSAYVSDAVISPHPRFGTLTASIRRRRGRKVDIQMPLYRDRNTRVAE